MKKIDAIVKVQGLKNKADQYEKWATRDLNKMTEIEEQIKTDKTISMQKKKELAAWHKELNKSFRRQFRLCGKCERKIKKLKKKFAI